MGHVVRIPHGNQPIEPTKSNHITARCLATLFNIWVCLNIEIYRLFKGKSSFSAFQSHVWPYFLGKNQFSDTAIIHIGMYPIISMGQWAKPPQPDLTFCGQKTSWCFFPRASERRVLPIVGVCISSSHLHTFSHTFSSSPSHLHTFSS